MRSSFAIIIGIIGAAGCANVEMSAVTELTIAPCDVGAQGMVTECGEMNVYENRKTKTGRIIPINFIRVRATGDSPAQDVFIRLTGGPGENASQSAAQTIANARTFKSRDLIIVDQRGTGKSNPLDCVKYDLAARPEAFADMFEKSFFDAKRFGACRDRLSENADLTQYTTSIIADDINDLREALGYQQMTLSGGSYGTTLGLEIIRRHGNYVRAAVLGGAMPPSVNQTETIAGDMEDMLEKLFVACDHDDACSDAFPNFKSDFRDVLERVRNAPVEVTLPHTLTQEPTKVRVHYEELVVGIRYALYSTRISAGLPLSVSEAKAGDYRGLTQLLPQILYLLSNVVSEGMWASVRCAEEFPFIDEARARDLSQGTVLGTGRLDSGNAICAFWPRGEAPRNFHEAVISDVPVLVLAGEVDVATPVWAGEEAARHLSKSRLVIIPNRSHWGLGGDECVDGIVDAFIESASVNALDVSCVAEFTRPPFIVTRP